MRTPFPRRALAPLALLALLAPLPWTASPALATHGRATPAVLAVQRLKHPRVYGYLMDATPATDSILLVYSKTHDVTYRVVMTAMTVVKIRTQVVHRLALHKGLYVMVTCRKRGDGTFEALTVHIENRHPRARSAH